MSLAAFPLFPSGAKTLDSFYTFTKNKSRQPDSGLVGGGGGGSQTALRLEDSAWRKPSAKATFYLEKSGSGGRTPVLRRLSEGICSQEPSLSLRDPGLRRVHVQLLEKAAVQENGRRLPPRTPQAGEAGGMLTRHFFCPVFLAVTLPRSLLAGYPHPMPSSSGLLCDTDHRLACLCL